MTHLFKSLRFAARQSALAPFNSLLCVVILACGMALVLSMLMVYQIAFLSDLPYPDSDDMCLVIRKDVHGNDNYAWPLESYRSFQQEQGMFADTLALFPDRVRFKYGEGNRAADAVYVTTNFAEMTGAVPVAGRSFSPDDARADAQGTVIIDEDLWHDMFDGDPDLSGKTLLVNGESRSVIGVMPRTFDGPYPMSGSRLWLPLNIDTITAQTGWVNIVILVGKIREGSSFEQAQMQADQLLANIARQLPEENKNISGTRLRPINDEHVDESGAILKVLLVCSFLVLFMACAITSGLTLARYAGRSQEIAIRSALGAPRGRIVVQMLLEFLVLAIPAAILGLLLNHLLGSTFLDYYLKQFSLPASMKNPDRTGLLLLSVPAMLVVTTVFSVIVPALRASRTDLNLVLHESTRTGTSAHSGKLSSLVISWQVATACIVLCGGALMGYYIYAVRNQNSWYSQSEYVCANFSFDPQFHSEVKTRSDIARQLIEKIENDPDFEKVALSNEFYGSNPDGDTHVWIEGNVYESEDNAPMVRKRIVSPGYFAATNTPILSGRDFTFDDGLDQPSVIVTDAFARTYFGTQDVLGRKLKIYEDGDYLTVVGVVPDVYNGRFFKPRQTGFFIPYAHEAWTDMVVFAKPHGEPGRMGGRLTDIMNSVDGRLCISDVMPLARMASRNSGGVFFEFVFAIFALFSLVALMMAAAGLFGIISLAVRLKQMDTAIRMVLGEQPFSSLLRNMKAGLYCILAGLGAGLLGTLLLRHFIIKYLGDVPENLWIYTSTLAALTLVCVLAVMLPSLRTLFMKPAEVFREG